ncbi:EamA family transporter [Rubrivivax gelatinosus]|uniref:EamA family transporter n=1 Tax=Rubrivivax gelatinosus TaxID=28068 RepID=A0ABS1DUZ7_RUBGE|nr:EamA family transporter [Rubrivivax gelatinosus]
MTRPTRRQLAVLLLLTLIWGLNWPVMKMGVSGTPAQPGGFPPLSFRAASMLIGLPLFGLALAALRVPLAVPRAHWGEVLRLTLPNMLVWHVIVILAVQSLSSGRAAILGYSMPVFAAVWGFVLYGERPGWRQAAGVAAAGLGIVLLLTHEFARLTGAPWAAGAMLVAAATWAYGTHRLRRSSIPVPLLAVSFWMTALTTAVMCVLAAVFESQRWAPPSAPVAWAIAYNAIGVFCFAQAAWFYLARTLPPVASSISVMMIPVLGTFSGAIGLGEALHWQDFAAMVLIVGAIAAVLGRPKPA